MNIRINPSALRETRWHEYLSRFVLGGLATVATGAIANVFGPETGGLFLAFPAIFCASATLIEKHERERKEKVGLRGTRRGKEAAALDAAGAALGSLGLLAFGAATWLLTPRSAWLALVVGSAAWFAVSVFLWSIRRWIWTWRCTSEPHH
jgi:Protein of unknown function (DUF3147)